MRFSFTLSAFIIATLLVVDSVSAINDKNEIKLQQASSLSGNNTYLYNETEKGSQETGECREIFYSFNLQRN